ncbi:hypothetical protein BLNAU_10901 [Blattamonas nauphoetae]|uniref:Uncharacterized protein n=1 Tax=Blattamonas nauphoetae TaxID=2049346 RepID=A0ABQ9XSD6_9EUKA|nr:hypothetical protein BLNAU_10901 [Blattamonas nauphoetae]
MMFGTILRLFRPENRHPSSPSTHPILDKLCDDVENKLSEALSCLFGRANREETTRRLLFSKLGADDIQDWEKALESLLALADKGRQFSDWELQTVLLLFKNCPCDAHLVFDDDTTFTIRVKDKMVSSSTLDVRSLWVLLTPTKLHHATPLLIAAQLVSRRIDIVDRVPHFWNGWLSHFFSAVAPSKLPFTPENSSLHAQLVDVMCDVISSFEKANSQVRLNPLIVHQNMLKKYSLSFLSLSKDYLIHLSHSAYPNHTHNKYTIDCLLDKVMRFDLRTPTTEAFRRELKEEMISSTLASSSPHFILTAELVCPLSDCETMDVVERIVGLLDSDCSLDDDSILRICVFMNRHTVRSLLPIFRNTGRTKEQYLHAFESFLSLHIESSKEAQIRTWDQLSIDTDSEEFNKFVDNFVLPSLQRARHCATRLTQTQLERLITPSIDCLKTYYQFCSLYGHEEKKLEKGFKCVCSLCDQPVVARGISRIGLFSQIVDHITSGSTKTTPIQALWRLFENDERRMADDYETTRGWRRGGVMMMREEGLEDAMDSKLFMAPIPSNQKCIGTNKRLMNEILGVNIPNLS